MIPEGPLLWYVNRGTGVALMVLLTLSILLGVWSTRGEAGTLLPRFVVQAVHRNVSLLAVVLLGVHVFSAVADEYVDIRWWQSVAPVDLAYKPLWLGLGTVALDLLLVVVVTSLLRHRLPRRAWWWVHVSTYLSWPVSLVHGIGIGTDTALPWVQWVYAGCAGLVVMAVVLRITGQNATPRSGLAAPGGTQPGSARADQRVHLTSGGRR